MLKGGDYENDIGVGVGLCGWTNANRGSQGNRTDLNNYANSKGTSWKDVNTQIEFLITQLNNGEGPARGYAQSIGEYGIQSCTRSGWINATNTDDATYQYCGWYERPSWSVNHMDRRQEAARKYYNQFKGKDLSEFESSGSSNATGKAKIILDAAESKLGCPYVWGAEGPNTFDCGGFTMWCYAQAGITISHAEQYADAQRMGQVLDISQAQPGDILYKPGHVGLCVSNENGVITYIHAPQTGDVVKYSTYSQFTHALRFF